MERTSSLIQRLIDIRSVQSQISNLQYDLEELETRINTSPDRDYSAPLQRISKKLDTLQDQVGRSTINSSHPSRRTVLKLSSHLLELSSLDKKPSPIATSSTIISGTPASRPVQLPKISLPLFEGDLMHWATFWSQFQAAVDSNTQLTNANKLAYLRRGVFRGGAQGARAPPSVGHAQNKVQPKL